MGSVFLNQLLVGQNTHISLFFLQEGMFNNANVIFRTKFVDGVSTVSRTIGAGANSRSRALANGGNTSGNEPAKRRRGRNNNGPGKENSVEA